MSGAITIITAVNPQTMGKHFSLDSDGCLVKETAGQLLQGRYEVAWFSSLHEFTALLQTIHHHQAIMSSLPIDGLADSGLICTAKTRVKSGGIPRTKENFKLKEGSKGVMSLDYDPPHGSKALSQAELWKLLREVAPEITGAGVCAWSSGSSFIHNGDMVLQGLRGQRFYILVNNTFDVKRAAAVLADRLWLAGYGRITISKAGSKLSRHVFDDAMCQDDRLDYIGGAVCQAPLDQRRGTPDILSDGGFSDTLLLFPDLSSIELAKVETLKAQATNDAEPAALVARNAFVGSTARTTTDKLVKEGIEPVEAARRGLRSAECATSGVLLGDYSITLENGETVTVGQVLDQKERYHEAITLDPVEPDYLKSKPVGKFYLYGSRPNLHSKAHGGRTFFLKRQPARVLLGDNSEAATALLNKLAEEPDLFIKAGSLVRVAGGRLIPLVTKSDMAYIVGLRVALFRTTRAGKEVPANLDEATAGMLLSAIKHPNKLREIKFVSTLPIVTQTRIVSRPGFDAETGGFAHFPETLMADWDTNPSESDLVAALTQVWKPLSAYKFSTDADRGAALAGLLTAVCRRAVDIAPGFVIDAPCAASGKTFLGQVLGSVMIGRTPPILPYAGTDDKELKKQITANVLAGLDWLMVDNITGLYKSPVMASLMTLGVWDSRKLGTSDKVSGEIRPLVVLTSNNAALSQELTTRFCRVRIDTGVENPATTHHRFNPLRVALTERDAIGKGLCMLVQGFLANRGAKEGAELATRFDEWGLLVRDCVLWIARTGLDFKAGILTFGDPAAQLNDISGHVDPETQALGSLLQGLSMQYPKNKGFSSSTLLRDMSFRQGDDWVVLVMEGVGDLSRYRGDLTSRTLGDILRFRVDRICQGLALRRSGVAKGVAHYFVETLTKK